MQIIPAPTSAEVRPVPEDIASVSLDAAFASTSAYASHQDVPVRIRVTRQVRRHTGWQATPTGAILLYELAQLGLSERDFLVNDTSQCLRIVTDNGGAWLPFDYVTPEQHGRLRDLLRQVAAGVARYRMLRRAGWNRRQVYPRWSITVSQTLVGLLETAGFAAEDLWSIARRWDDDIMRTESFGGDDASTIPQTDVRSALPARSDVVRHETGLLFDWSDDGLEYSEYGCARVALDRVRLRGLSNADLVGRRLDELVGGASPLLALIGERIVTGVAELESSSSRLTLTLSIDMLTLAPIPTAVLAAAKISCPSRARAARPWWILTTPDLIRGAGASARAER